MIVNNDEVVKLMTTTNIINTYWYSYLPQTQVILNMIIQWLKIQLQFILTYGRLYC